MDYSSERIEPFRIFGGLYYVGARFGTSHLIDTGEGLILVDTGIAQTLYQIVQSIWQMGFDPHDIKFLVHSHGHFDHTGGTVALQALSGAKTFLGAEDVDIANGKLPLSWAAELGFPPVEPFFADVALHDRDVIELGNTKITCLSTPGHTPGVMSFFFAVTDGKQTFRAGMHGGVGMNSMAKKYLEKHHLPLHCREQFRNGLDRLEKEHVDIHLGNHIGNNHMLEKYEQMKNGRSNPFIDTTSRSWYDFLQECRKNLTDMLDQEKY